MKKQLLAFVFVVSMFTGVQFAVAAQDVTLEPSPSVAVVTATALPETPTPEVTVEPTPAPVPVPDPAPGGISPQVLFLVIVTLGGLVATVLLQQKSIHDALLQAGELLPSWAWEGLKTASISGLDALQAKAKETIATDDDTEVARLRQIAVDTINEIDAKRAVKAQTPLK